MSYVDKPYLQKQFENFKQKIAEVFAKKEAIPTKTSDLDNDSGFVTSQYPVEILDEEATEANTTPDKYVSDALVTRNLITRMGGLDFKLEDGVPKWSPRGADTFVPFSSNIYKNMTYRQSPQSSFTMQIDASIDYKLIFLYMINGTNNKYTIQINGADKTNEMIQSENVGFLQYCGSKGDVIYVTRTVPYGGVNVGLLG